jgi:hypothetical protein
VRVAALPASRVEHAGAERQAEDVEDASDLLTVARKAEQRLVLVEVPRIEKRRPPLRTSGTSRRQKKTGSR